MFLNKKITLFYILIIIFILILIYISGYHFSLITYFYVDNLYIEHLHNLSLKKNIFEVLINKYTINGLSIYPHEPKLNILSSLNYNLENQNDYLYYLSILRLIEIITIFLGLIIFLKKNYFSIYSYLSLSLILFLLLLDTFSIFDHQSYINFPIIVFNFAIFLSLYFVDRIKIFCSILFFGNLISYFINPMYFFISCFGPSVFLYLILIKDKRFKNLICSILINFPFALSYSLLNLGLARLSLNENFLPVEDHYNFAIYTSHSFQIIFVIIITLNIIQFFLKIKNEAQYLYNIIYAFMFITLFSGAIYKYKIISWFLPSPIYIDYSLQYIYIILFTCILLSLTYFDYKFIILFFFILSIYKFSVTHFKSFINSENIINENVYYYPSLKKRHFWEKNEKLFLSEKYKNASLIIDLPDDLRSGFKPDTSYLKYLFKNQEIPKYFSFQSYNEKFNHSLNPFEFHKNFFVTNYAHSIMLDISSFKANQMNENMLYPKERVPKIDYNSSILQIYQAKYLLTDKKLPDLYLEEVYNFNDFEFYIYKLNIYNSKEYKEFKIIKNFNNYLQDTNYFNKYIFTLKKNIKDKVKLCDVTRIYNENNSRNIEYKISTSEYCLAIFSITFSKTNNLFYEENQEFKKCDTFRVQYYFHGCFFNKNTKIRISKKNIITYPFYSFIDFLEWKRLVKLNN